MQKVKQLIIWAKAQSRSLKTASQKSKFLSTSNIYFARAEWIDFELLPKLKEILHISSNKHVARDLITVMNSCVEGYSGEWDPMDEGAAGFQAMYQLLQRVADHYSIDTSEARQFPEE